MYPDGAEVTSKQDDLKSSVPEDGVPEEGIPGAGIPGAGIPGVGILEECITFPDSLRTTTQPFWDNFLVGQPALEEPPLG